MKKILSLVLLMSFFLVAEASTCFVDKGSPESAMEYINRVKVSAEKIDGLAEVSIFLPNMAGEYLLSEVFLVVSKLGGNENEIFVPVATKEIDKQTLGISLTLPISLLHRTNLVVTYGRCGKEYSLELSSLAK